MELTKDFRQTVRARATRDAAFRKALFQEAVQTLLQGALRRSPQEAQLLAEAEKTFDLLYDAYFEPAKR